MLDCVGVGTDNERTQRLRYDPFRTNGTINFSGNAKRSIDRRLVYRIDALAFI